MKFEIHHFHHLGAEDTALLLRLKLGLLSVEAKLDRIQETLKIMGALQEKIDLLTEKVNTNTEAAIAAIKNEGEEIKRAIDNPNVDTSALEAAIARSEELTALVNAMYTAPGETPPIGEIPPTDENSEPVKVPPTDDEPTDTEPTADGTGTDTSGEQTTAESDPSEAPTEELPADETEENNQPSDVEPPTEETTGFDDQERTPVPEK